uniref:Uncharacterized protein n=1 Tax=Arundo donax TaxID=35708 RepID=A0A0A8Y2U7_ARUDO
MFFTEFRGKYSWKAVQ